MTIPRKCRLDLATPIGRMRSTYFVTAGTVLGPMPIEDSLREMRLSCEQDGLVLDSSMRILAIRRNHLHPAEYTIAALDRRNAEITQRVETAQLM